MIHRTRLHSLVSYASLVILLAAACTPEAGPTTDIIVQGETVRKEEVQRIELDNCDGKADATRIEQRTRSIDVTISTEVAAKIGASVEVVSAEVQSAVGLALAKGSADSTSIQLVAPPSTRMVFQLVWEGNEQIGVAQNIRNSSIPVAFRSFLPTDVRIQSQSDIGCSATTSPQPIFEPTALPDPPEATSPPAGGQNLISNGDFENPLEGSGWEWSDQLTLISGYRNSTAVSSVKTANAAFEWVGLAHNVVVTTGSKYSFTAWLNWRNAAQVHMKILWFDEASHELGATFVMDPVDGSSPGWVRRGGEAIALPGAVRARLFFWHGVRNGAVNVVGSELWIDDVVFAEITSPTTAAAPQTVSSFSTAVETAFPDWQVPPGHDAHTEYRRCRDYPDDSFPEFDIGEPGYIRLEPQSARDSNGKYTWCFQIRSTRGTDALSEYYPDYTSHGHGDLDNLAMYICAAEASGLCAEPGRVMISREGVVTVDDSCVLSPVTGDRNGISIKEPRTIRVTLPANTVQSPTIAVGPYPVGNPAYIVCG